MKLQGRNLSNGTQGDDKERCPMQKFVFPRKLPTDGKAGVALDSKSVGELHGLLRKLKLPVDARDLARKELGTSTTHAIRVFQERAGLPVEEALTGSTVARLNAEIEHAFVAGSKTRTQRLQEMLQKVGMSIDVGEIRSRRFGPSTLVAVREFQRRRGSRSPASATKTARATKSKRG